MRVFQIATWPMPRTKSGIDTENRRRFYASTLRFGGRVSFWLGLYFIEINITTYHDPSVGQRIFDSPTEEKRTI